MEAGRWVAFRARRLEPEFRLFCLPYAGGGANLFRNWAQDLPRRVEVCPVELPGRGARLGEPPTTNLKILVGEMSRGLEPLLNIPFAIFGASMGGLVGFELARELRRRGRDTAALLVAAQNAPRVVSSRNGSDAAPRRHLFSEEDFGSMLRHGGRIPEAAIENPRFMRVFGPMIRADHALVDTYEHEAGKPLQCPLSILIGEEDSTLSEEDLAGWQAETSAKCSFHYFPGGHFFFEDSNEQVVRVVSDAIGRVT